MAVYKTKKKFKYGGQMLQAGEVWKPVGGKWDEQIKEHLVYLDESEPNIKAVKRGSRSK